MGTYNVRTDLPASDRVHCNHCESVGDFLRCVSGGKRINQWVDGRVGDGG